MKVKAFVFVLSMLSLITAKAQDFVIPAGTVVPLKSMSEMKLDEDDQGKQLVLEVADHVIIGSRVAINKGTVAKAHVLSATDSKMFGGSGSVSIQFDCLLSDNGQIPLSDVPYDLRGKNRKGTAIASAALLGVGAFFIKGGKAELDPEKVLQALIPADITIAANGDIVVGETNPKYMATKVQLPVEKEKALNQFFTSNVENKVKKKKPQKGNVRIKLTGTAYENMTLIVGNGYKEEITSLPYEFDVPKTALPLNAKIESPNYNYHPISIVKKPQGGIGHVYMIHAEQKAAGAYAGAPIQQTIVKEIIREAPAEITESKPTVDWSQEINKAPVTKNKAENTFALIIANEEYDMVSHVAMANNDGLVFKEYCQKTLGLGENNIKYYPNATYGNMSRAFREVADIAKAFNGDINLIFYYAGHGIPDNSTKDAYLMPIDADGTDTGVCYSLKRLYDQIESFNVNQCVVFMDACFSGAKRDNGMIVAARGVAIKAKEEKPKSSTIVFSATSDDEAAYSYDKEQHGLFTYFLLKKLQESKGKVDLGDLAEYLTTTVGQNSILINGKKQTPTVVVSDKISSSWKRLKLTM